MAPDQFDFSIPKSIFVSSFMLSSNFEQFFMLNFRTNNRLQEPVWDHVLINLISKGRALYQVMKHSPDAVCMID